MVLGPYWTYLNTTTDVCSEKGGTFNVMNWTDGGGWEVAFYQHDFLEAHVATPHY